MPTLRTDDAIRRTRLEYLGPQDYTLPVFWTYGRWGATVATVLGGDLAVGFGLHAVGVGIVGIAIAEVWSTATAGLVTAWLYRKVNPDRPLRAVLRTLATDWRTSPADEQPQPTATRMPTLYGGEPR